ncbi:MAG: RagB/SusD family nutrient uptake outer membrane protein [Bacteroidales bacterium]|nr:RagB/SusD family nutrient uptake outer membrane protein [Bacteroidales bacterium]
MKKLYILFVAAAAMVSCKGFLDRAPFNQNSSESMFTSSVLAESVVTGVYSNLLYDFNTTDRSVLNWDSFSSVMDPSESINNLDYNYLFGTVLANNGMFTQYWKRFYEGVNRANDVIANIGSVPNMSDELKSRRIAECKFLRAWYYYRLNYLWRGVPIYTRNLAPSEYTKGRETEEAVWRFIVDELTEVIENPDLPKKYASGNTDYGRVTKGAAYALRGKAYLWLKDWENAEKDFISVGECGYKLFTGSYADLFTESNEKCDEMVFSVQMVEESGNGNAFSNNYGNYCTTGYGKYQHYLNVNFVDSFENADGKPFNWDDYLPGYNSMSPRERSVFFLRNGLNDTEKSAMNAAGADMSKYDETGNEARIKAAYAARDPRLAAIAITPYSTYVGGASGANATYTSRYPYRDWQSPSLDLRYGSNTYMLYSIRKFVTVGREYTNIAYNPVDIPLIRYADVLLSLAEALNEQGRWQEAVTYVNMVRNRAGATPLNKPGNEYVTVSGEDDMRVRIRNEKRWELACEEQLFPEELRWGTWKETKFAQDNGLQNVWGEPIYKYIWGGNAFYKFAIPQSEREKNTNLEQNEDWH